MDQHVHTSAVGGVLLIIRSCRKWRSKVLLARIKIRTLDEIRDHPESKDRVVTE